ncbi:hypothetical protein ACFL2H_05945 [Planctomycetota bacterium]
MNELTVRGIIQDDLVTDLTGMLFGDGSATEWLLRWSLETLCRLDNRSHDWVDAVRRLQLQTDVVQTLQSESLSATPAEVKSVFAEVAFWLDYLPIQNLSDAAYKRIAESRKRFISTPKLTMSSVTQEFGEPTWFIKCGLDRVLCYGTEKKADRWFFLFFRTSLEGGEQTPFYLTSVRGAGRRSEINRNTQTTEVSSKPWYVNTVFDCLSELSDLSFQRRNWSSVRPVSHSLDEVLDQLFDDTGIREEIEMQTLAGQLGGELAMSIEKLLVLTGELDKTLPIEQLVEHRSMERVRSAAQTAHELCRTVFGDQ